jgi:uncharacterized protein (DUF2062 family)
MSYKRPYRAMVSIVQPLLADALVNGMAVLSAGLVSYLFWLRFREGREQRRQRQERKRDRRKHWGYE